MSGGALFGNNASRSGSKNLVEFKAGKMTMKGKMVYPDNRKGLLYVYQSEDSLMHFCWKDRTSGVVEDDLIIFPDDCEFKHVPQCKTGRVYLLRFKSSSRKFFFWLQDLKTEKDEEHCRKINEVLNNPPTPGSSRSNVNNPEGDLQNLLNNMSQQQLMQLFGGVGGVSGLGTLLGTINRSHANIRNSTTNSSTSVTTTPSRPPTSQTPVSAPSAASTQDTSKNNKKSSSRTTTTTTNSPTPSIGSSSTSTASNRIQLSDLQNFLSGISIPTGSEPAAVQRGVASELTNAIPGAITTSESLEQAVKNYLPPKDNLCTTLSSPQFSQALSMFWSALQSGQAGPMVRQFGLGSDAVNAAATGNIEQFVTALETETKSATSQERPTKDDAQPAKQSPPADANPPDPNSEKKEDDDDEGMALD